MIVMLGSFRVSPDRVKTLTNHARAMLHATQDEEGCIAYAFAEDIDEPGLIHVLSRWETRAAWDAHLRSPHAVAWRMAQAEIGVMAHTVETFDMADQAAEPAFAE